MKKVKFLVLGIAAMAAVFTSCSKEDDTTNPTLQLVTPSSSAVEVVADSTVSITVNVADETELASIKTYKNGSSLSEFNVTTFTDPKSKVYNVSVQIDAACTIKIEATDKAGNINNVEITFTIKAATPLTVVTVTADDANGAFIGAGGSSFGSYVDIDGGKIYHTANVAANAAAIDAVFNTTSLYDNGTGFTSTNCKFKKTTLDFTTATVESLVGLTADLTEIALVQGDVIYFKTGAAKEGLVLIKTLTAATGANNDAKITIEVKVKP
jgi:hypothetical protein